MVIKVRYPQVINNLSRFRNTLMETKELLHTDETRDYWVLFNRRTGDMRFLQKLSSLESFFFEPYKKRRGSLASDWQELHLVIEPQAKEPSFSVVNEKREKVSEKGFDEVAAAILFETLRALNERIREIELSSSTLPEEMALQDLSAFQTEVGVSNSSKETLAPWLETISRIQAEAILKGQPLGTYLFRKCDAISREITRWLAWENKERIEAYLLTFVNREDKISERLILQTKKGWTIYRGEPELSERFYAFSYNLKTLLEGV